MGKHVQSSDIRFRVWPSDVENNIPPTLDTTGFKLDQTSRLVELDTVGKPWHEKISPKQHWGN